MNCDDAMYLNGFRFAADSIQNWPTVTKYDVRVAREQFAVSMSNSDPWSRGRIDGFLSAFGY